MWSRYPMNSPCFCVYYYVTLPSRCLVYWETAIRVLGTYTIFALSRNARPAVVVVVEHDAVKMVRLKVIDYLSNVYTWHVPLVTRLSTSCVSYAQRTFLCFYSIIIVMFKSLKRYVIVFCRDERLELDQPGRFHIVCNDNVLKKKINSNSSFVMRRIILLPKS